MYAHVHVACPFDICAGGCRSTTPFLLELLRLAGQDVLVIPYLPSSHSYQNNNIIIF